MAFVGSGPWDYGTEVGAAQLLKQLSDYTSVLVRQEIRRAQLEGNIPPSPDSPERETLAGTGGLLVLIGVVLLVAAGMLGLTEMLAIWQAAIVAGGLSVLVGAALMLLVRRRAACVRSSGVTSAVAEFDPGMGSG